jgi:CBS domain containing-hemolysin-like protein
MFERASDEAYIFVGAVALVLLLVTGLTAGLATGLLGLDATHLEVLRTSGNAVQKRVATRLQALLSRHNLVLFSIVLLHAIADEALPLVLERVCNEYVAVALSVPLVLLFGEVIPSAGDHQQITTSYTLSSTGTLISCCHLFWDRALPLQCSLARAVATARLA